MFDEILSHDDSDNNLETKVKKFNLGRLGQLKSTMTSSNNTQNIANNNNRLKQVRSSSQIFKTGVIEDLHKGNEQNNF